MSMKVTKDNVLQPSTLQEALNVIQFLKTSHKQEIVKLKQINQKQAEIIKKLETNRKKELDFLSNELHKYEINLQLRTEAVASQLANKDDIIQKQIDIIENLHQKLKLFGDNSIPEIKIHRADSNSDSGIALDNDDSISKTEETKVEVKVTKKCSKRFADSISFLRKVDFSPIRYKPSSRDGKKKEEKKHVLEIPAGRMFLSRQFSNDRSVSDDDRSCSGDQEEIFEPIVIRPKPINDSMNNHFSDDGSEDTSEEVFDRVMIRSSIRRSIKSNPKYKKISRSKSKLLDQVKLTIAD